jgi:hypothetical protein
LKRLIAFILALSLCGCTVDKEALDDASRVTTSAGVSGNIAIASIFPRTPMIAEGGSIALTAVVTDGAGTVLESKKSDPVTVSWTTSNSSIVSIDEKGGIFGKKLGSAIVTAVASRGSDVSASYSVIVHVTSINSVGVAELFFNPMQAYVDLNAERVFRLSAVDSAGAAYPLSEGRVEFVASSENVRLTPSEINLTQTGNAVEVKVGGLRKGFSFITPYYFLTSADGTQTVQITGTPLVVQVKDSVETGQPDAVNYFSGGDYLSIAVGETGGYKTIYATHYDVTAKGFLFSDFYSSWQHKTIVGGEGTGLDAGKANAIALSPFDSNLNLPIVLSIEGARPVLRYQNVIDGGWFKTAVLDATDADIIDANKSYAERNRLTSVTAFRAPEGSGLENRVHVAYFDALLARVCITSFSSPTTKIASSRQCVGSNNAPVHSVSIAHNRLTGEPRMIYGHAAYTYIGADGNETNVSEKLYYVARQSGDLYREELPIDGGAGYASLALDRNNKPLVALKEGSYIRLYSREAASDNTFQWARDPLSGMSTTQREIGSVSFGVDDYNEPRIAFSSNTGSGLKVRYARKPPFRNLGARWVVEDLDQNLAGDQGVSSAIAVDSANRAHLVYSVASKKWFNYWAEPNFFDYRNFPYASYSRADLIDETKRVP